MMVVCKDICIIVHGTVLAHTTNSAIMCCHLLCDNYMFKNYICQCQYVPPMVQECLTKKLNLSCCVC